jgi:polyphosphate kinase
MGTADNHFVNRELSWLSFNGRVLSEALRPEVPLLERLKFLCIVASNLDEFFMVRVASVKRQVNEGDHVQCPSGIRPSALLTEIRRIAGEMTQQAHESFTEDLVPSLAREGLVVRRLNEFTDEHRRAAGALFRDEIFPVLTPVRVTSGSEFPYTASLKLHAAFQVEPVEGGDPLSRHTGEEGPSLAIVQIPSSLGRLIPLPDEPEVHCVGLLEDLVVEFAHLLFPGYVIREHCLFRVTRDADLGVDEERDEDFVDAMRDVITSRQHSRPVRLTASSDGGELAGLLADALGLAREEVYKIPKPLDLGGFMAMCGLPGFDRLRYRQWKPAPSPLIPEDSTLWATLSRKDVLLHHPFEQFDPVVRIVQDAANDPSVLSIKITLYRTGGDSPIVRALESAARSGKHVTAVVELKARFDEQQNIEWATRLQHAGVIVVYGIARLKIHAKAMLIVRRSAEGITRFAHLGTGNYNDKTARLYTDFGLLTSRSDVVYELGLFFNAITGYSAIPSLKTLAMAPVNLKARVLQLIDRERLRSESGEAGLIIAKLNSLADPDVIEALYSASAAGVEVQLNVRGVCMLRPGLKGLSESITVVSVVDRFLEHARAFYFENGGAPEVYCSSADWMPRNLERRVELMFPVEDHSARARVVSALKAAFLDNVHGHLIGPDGRSTRIRPAASAEFESQRHLQEAAEARVSETHGEDLSTFEVRRTPPEA